MNTDKPNSPRYFRLLEKGETIEKSDLWISNITDPSGSLETTNHPGLKVDCGTYFRPVTVDPWISYAEQKPTKEDFQPTGKIEVFFPGGEEIAARTYNETIDWDTQRLATHWRRRTLPTPAKPKSVDLVLEMSDATQAMTLRADGTVKLRCGSEIQT